MKKQHRDERGLGDFERHRRERGSDDLRHGRRWQFRHGGFGVPSDAHYRTSTRTAALAGKHMRPVKEPARAAHGKSI